MFAAPRHLTHLLHSAPLPQPGLGLLQTGLLTALGLDLQRLGRELESGDNIMQINSLAFRALCLSTAILDSIASTAERFRPVPGRRGHIYFLSYQFADQVLQQQQTRIAQLTFSNMFFRDLGNAVKHDAPWLGMVSTRNLADRNEAENMKWDVYDAQGVGLYTGVLSVCYKALCTMVEHMSEKHIDVVKTQLPQLENI